MSKKNPSAPEVKAGYGKGILPKILCVVFAFILWFYIVGFQSPVVETDIASVPLTIETYGDLSVYNVDAADISLTVSGKRSEIMKLTAEDFSATVDATSITNAGRHQFIVEVAAPSGIDVIDQSEKTVWLYLDTKSSVTVPITVDSGSLQYQIEEGYEIDASKITAAETGVKLTGPSSFLKRVAEVRAVVPPLGSITGTVNVSAELMMYSEDGTLLKNSYTVMETSNVSVKIPLYRTMKVPVEVKYKYNYFNDSNVSITLDPSEVNVKGEASLLKDSAGIAQIEIDEKQAKDTGTYKITLPDGVSSSDGITSVMTKITHKGTSTKTLLIDRSAINVINPDGLKYQIETESVSLTVRAQTSALSSVDKENVTLTLDLSSYTNSGAAATLPLTVSLGDTGAYELGSYTVSVKFG